MLSLLLLEVVKLPEVTICHVHLIHNGDIEGAIKGVFKHTGRRYTGRHMECLYDALRVRVLQPVGVTTVSFGEFFIL